MKQISEQKRMYSTFARTLGYCNIVMESIKRHSSVLGFSKHPKLIPAK